MASGPQPVALELTEEERAALEGLVRRRNGGQAVAKRARVDEKPQIRVAERTAPLLPMRPGWSSGAATTVSGTALPTCPPRSPSKPAR